MLELERESGVVRGSGTAKDGSVLAERSADLIARYGHLDGISLLRPMFEREFAGRIGVVSSFGVEAAVLLDIVAQVDRSVPVLFIDTLKLFPETLAYRETLIERLGLEEVRVIAPDSDKLADHDADETLWKRDPDHCCHIRKVLPLERHLTGFDAWVTGRKRYQGGVREELPTIEADGHRTKINPLARWTREDVLGAFRDRSLPHHPLVTQGYPSVGCLPCTRRTNGDWGSRQGRWSDREKTECGIHKAKWARR